MKAVIQAGGKGSRLRPFTMVLPKPLMPVAGHPVIELLLKWLRKNGVLEAYITTGYLGNLIKSICGDGEQWSIRVGYTDEYEPLGTIGPLKLLDPACLDDSFFVLNGDLITDLDLRGFMRHHKESGALVTIASTQKEVKIDLGVLDVQGNGLVGFREKPVVDFQVSMGIYCMERGILDLIPAGVPFGFDDLMATMLENNIPVNVYEHKGMWMDIGRIEDFEHAQQTFVENQGQILGI